MAHGQPDFWVASVPAMPIIGEGQVAWFQSQLEEVAGNGNEDLINYVVPDDMELHICSGVVSCAFPVLQRYKLITTPAATWVRPTGHNDPDAKWNDAEDAYNGNVSDSAWSPVSAGAWSSFLGLVVNEQNIDKVRFWAWYRALDINKIDVDVRYEGDWHDVYEGAYANREWVEKDIPDGVKLVSKARVRFYNSGVSDYWCFLYEFMFNTSGETGQKGIYFDTHAIIPYLPQAPYIVPAGATFAIRVYNDDDDAHNMSVSLAGFLQAKV